MTTAFYSSSFLGQVFLLQLLHHEPPLPPIFCPRFHFSPELLRVPGQSFHSGGTCIASASEKCCHVVACHRAARAAWSSSLGWPGALQDTLTVPPTASVFLCSIYSPVPLCELALVSLRRWKPARFHHSPCSLPARSSVSCLCSS